MGKLFCSALVLALCLAAASAEEKKKEQTDAAPKATAPFVPKTVTGAFKKYDAKTRTLTIAVKKSPATTDKQEKSSDAADKKSKAAENSKGGETATEKPKGTATTDKAKTKQKGRADDEAKTTEGESLQEFKLSDNTNVGFYGRRRNRPGAKVDLSAIREGSAVIILTGSDGQVLSVRVAPLPPAPAKKAG